MDHSQLRRDLHQTSKWAEGALCSANGYYTEYEDAKWTLSKMFHRRFTFTSFSQNGTSLWLSAWLDFCWNCMRVSHGDDATIHTLSVSRLNVCSFKELHHIWIKTHKFQHCDHISIRRYRSKLNADTYFKINLYSGSMWKSSNCLRIVRFWKDSRLLRCEARIHLPLNFVRLFVFEAEEDGLLSDIES